MDSQLNLKLRSDPRTKTIIRQQHVDAKHAKREHIKEMLIQNFNRRYCPKPTANDDASMYVADQTINDEAGLFVNKNPNAINSKELA